MLTEPELERLVREALRARSLLVLDTNTALSGLLWSGTPKRLIVAARAAVRIQRTSIDPDDDAVLAAALAAPADLIVSGDAHLLNLKAFHRIPIITAAEAVDRIAQSSRG